MTKKYLISRNKNQYDSLTSVYEVIDIDGSLNYLAYLANNLYNMALYQIRQQLFKHRTLLKYSQLDQLFRKKFNARENMTYGRFPYRQMAQQTLREVSDVIYAWTQARKAYIANPHKFMGKPRLPHYLPSGKRHTFHVTNQNAKVKNGYLIIQPRNGSFSFRLKLAKQIGRLQRVTFKPLSKQRFKVIVQYQPVTKEIKYLADNQRYMGIDPGLDNAFTCVINDHVSPLIINGRGIKSVNQFYNKRNAELNKLHALNNQCFQVKPTQQGLKRCYYHSNAQQTLTNWRNHKVREFSHQATKRIIDYALNNDVHTIVIGKNKGWKRSADMGKKNNQNFVGIPHAQMINLLTYKANQHGISVITTNESYTSQTSFLDGEKPCWANGNKQRKKKHLSPINRRIKRGLFKSNHGMLINADVNGALQIIKKVFPDASFANGTVDAVLHPVKWSPLF